MAETIRMKLKKSTQKWKNLRDKYFRLWREQKTDLSQERKPRTVKEPWQFICLCHGWHRILNTVTQPQGNQHIKHHANAQGLDMASATYVDYIVVRDGQPRSLTSTSIGRFKPTNEPNVSLDSENTREP